MTNEELAVFRFLETVAELKSEIESLKRELQDVKCQLEASRQQIEFEYYTSGGTARALSFHVSGTGDGGSGAV